MRATVERRIFGTDGIRGEANVHPMTPEVAMNVGKALAYSIKRRSGVRRPKVVIGKDTRLSGYMFEQALAAGVISMGGDVLLLGPLPTPAIAFITANMRAHAGVVISASHNPYTDNGIKIFDGEGFKLPDDEERRLEELMSGAAVESSRASPTEIGKATRIDDAPGRYVVYVKNTFPRDLDLGGIKIVLDCANGASYKVAPTVFAELGADVVSIGVEPDGRNINLGCGSLEPDLLSRHVRDHGADIGIALDGDADRVVFCDHTGREVDGDKILALCADELHRDGRLARRTVVATVMSNSALEEFLAERGCRLVRTPVGDRYVVEEMRRGGYSFGGEKSGHIVFMEHSTTGDGTLAALQVLATMVRRERSLAELAGGLELYPQRLLSVRVREKVPLEGVEGLEELLRDCRSRLGSRGRLNLRYSGTEPVLRIMVEGKDESATEAVAAAIANHIEETIGAGERCQS